MCFQLLWFATCSQHWKMGNQKKKTNEINVVFNWTNFYYRFKIDFLSVNIKKIAQLIYNNYCCNVHNWMNRTIKPKYLQVRYVFRYYILQDCCQFFLISKTKQFYSIVLNLITIDKVISFNVKSIQCSMTKFIFERANSIYSLN